MKQTPVFFCILFNKLIIFAKYMLVFWLFILVYNANDGLGIELTRHDLQVWTPRSCSLVLNQCVKKKRDTAPDRFINENAQ